MKYLIDLSSPTDVLLFKGLKGELEKRGHEVFLITRNFGNNYIYRLAEKHGMFPDVIGSHGMSLYDKLIHGGARVISLATHIKFELGLEDFCGVISNSNPEICRVGFGLGLKVFSWNDSPDLQVAQTRLTSSLSDWIFTPWIVPFPGGDYKVFQYKALFPMAWLQDWKRDQFILYDLDIRSAERTVIAFRESETRASYLREKDLSIEAVKTLAEKHQSWQFITCPRYNYKTLVNKFGEVPHNVNIQPFPMDFPSLMAESNLFLGGGGTMMIEAAYCGTPAISTREKTTYYEKFLVENGLVFRAETVKEAVELAEEKIKTKTDNKIFSEMKYPLEEITSILEE